MATFDLALATAELRRRLAAHPPARRARCWAATVLRLPRRIWGRLTADRRALPDFLVIGTMKGGTTSLFHYLSQHPRILPSEVKQVRYFDGGPDRGRDRFLAGERWYRSHFPLSSTLQRAGAITGEASPKYLFHPLAPERIHRLLPRVKLVVMLREPGARAISHYWHAVRRGDEKRGMMEAFRAEQARLALGVESRRYRAYAAVHEAYLARGFYERQLRRYLALFEPRQVFLGTLEELARAPRLVLARLFTYLAVDPQVTIPDLEIQNRGRAAAVPEDVARLLSEVFARENERLYALLGRRLGWERPRQGDEAPRSLPP